MWQGAPQTFREVTFDLDESLLVLDSLKKMACTDKHVISAKLEAVCVSFNLLKIGLFHCLYCCTLLPPPRQLLILNLQRSNFTGFVGLAHRIIKTCSAAFVQKTK